MPGPPHPRRSLRGYADGSLTGWRRRLLGRHLRRCTRCSLEVERNRSLTAWLARSQGPAPGEELLRRLRRIAGEPASPTSATSPADVPSVPAVPPPGAAVPPGGPPPGRATVGVAGVLVAAAVVMGSAGVGAVVTGVEVPLPGAAAARAQLSTVLPALWSRPDGRGGTEAPGGAGRGPSADNGRRP